MYVLPDFQFIIGNERPSAARLSPTSRVFLQTALDNLMMRYIWVQSAETQEPITDAQWDDLDASLSKAAKELMENALIGQVTFYICNPAPDGVLPCDGSTYLRVDYPELYAALDTAFIIDADTFVLPDLRGRFVVSVGTLGSNTYNLGDIGGEASHTLTIDEMPSHAHTDTGHSHTTGNSLPGLALAPGEEPVLVPNPLPAFTGSASANIQNTGGGGAHENRPPFLALNVGVYAW